MHTMQDADQARLWAIDALEKGRLALGLALARIAVYASRAAARIPQTAPVMPVSPADIAFLPAAQGGMPPRWSEVVKDDAAWRQSAAEVAEQQRIDDQRIGVDPDASMEAHYDAEADLPADGPGLSVEAEATIAAQLDRRYAKPQTSAPVLESARCLAAITGRSGGGPVGEQCWGVLYRELVTGVWRHMVPDADGDHVPEPTEPGQTIPVELPERRS